MTVGLEASELAAGAGATVERIEALVGMGLLTPDADGRFSRADVQRVEVIAAYERGGITLDELARAHRDGHVTFAYAERIYPEPSAPSGRTVGDLMADLGPAAAVVPDLFVALGLPRPTAERRLTEADEAMIPAFLEAWGAPELPVDTRLRAARVIGDAARRATEGWVALFMEAVDLPADERLRLTAAALGARLFEPATRVAALLEPMSAWLMRHHLERALNALNVETMERSLELSGERVPVNEPPAILFADMAGFTRLTEELGDEVAARHATTLAQLGVAAAEAREGRLVKQLGDGVMLAFRRVPDGVAGAFDLQARAAEAGLPPLHIGLTAGALVERDGDFFGRVVNLASRISGVAGPGELLASEAARDAAGSVRATDIGPRALKGFEGPVRLWRIEPPGP